MKIAIAGTRGIPNTYGGFEQCAQFLSALLVRMGHEVIVYNTHYHPYQKKSLDGAEIVRKYNPEKTIGTAGNFIYDYLCMKDAVRREADILLVLGYTTAAVFYPLLNFKKTVLVTNMDGLEWKRDKWNGLIKKLARWFEQLGANGSHYLIADNPEIENYLKESYGKASSCIAYGCSRFTDADVQVPAFFGVSERNYGMVIARMEPENNIKMAIEGFKDADWDGKLLVVGNTDNAYGKAMIKLASNDSRIRFTGGIYNQQQLNSLRYFSAFYIHGHSVGGTNPSLLEAMACGCLLLIHNNPFNKAVVKGNAIAFDTRQRITEIINNREFEGSLRENQISRNYQLVETIYSWDHIAGEYAACFEGLLSQKPVEKNN